MYTIQTLNRISDCIREVLPEERYRIDEAAQAPDAVLVRSADMHGMEAPQSLLAVARAGAGYNNIPVDEYTKRGVCVFNTPGANANAVAELVLLGLLLSGRRVVDGIEWARALKGRESVPGLVEKGKGQFAGPELRGKTLGVIGLGAIGILVANAAAQGLGMTVLGEDPFISVQHAWSLSRAVQRVDSVEEILAQSDCVTVHVPLSEKTCGMIDSAALERMKPGARLLNFSRAELVDGEAVRAALQAGKLAAYITDFPTDDMLGAPGVVCIPHLGASTPESEENCARMAAEELRAYLETGSIHNSVNLPEMQLGRPEGARLQVIHANAPGMVSRISAIISGEGINIENMTNKGRGDWAVTVLETDQPLPGSAMEALRALPQAVRVRAVL